MPQNIGTSNFGVEASAIGYDLFRNVTDNLGRNHLLMASHKNGGGNFYFDSLSACRTWMRQVAEIQMMQNDPERWARINYGRICVEFGWL